MADVDDDTTAARALYATLPEEGRQLAVRFRDEGMPKLQAAQKAQRMMQARANAARVAAEPDESFGDRALGQLQAFGRGGLQGLTAGFSDELAGAAGAASQASGRGAPVYVGDDGQVHRREDAYRVERDASREVDAAARARSPIAFGVGQVAGGLATLPLTGGAKFIAAGPSALMRAARAAGVGAGVSGVAAAGGAEELRDVPSEALKGAALGAAVGAGAQALPGTGRALLERVKRPLQRFADQADELRVLTAMGATGGTISSPKVLKEAARVPGGVKEMARVMRATPGLAPKWLGTTSGIKEAADEAAEKAGAEIGRVVTGTEAAGETVDVAAAVARMRRTAGDLLADPATAEQGMQLFKTAQAYERYGRAAPRSMGAVNKSVNELAKPAFSVAAGGVQDPLKRAAGKEAVRALREQMDAAAGRALGPAEVPAYKGARRSMQVASIVGDAAEESLQRAGKNRDIGLMDVATGQLGAQAGGGMRSAVLAMAGRRLGAGTGAVFRATAAETARDMLKRINSTPGLATSLGSASDSLLMAALRGGAFLEREHERLLREDPRYRAVAEGGGR